MRIGEVIQSSSVNFIAQGYDLNSPPPLGLFVTAGLEVPNTIGIVQNVRVEPFDPSRPVLARGKTLETEQEVFRESPQLLDLLTIRFDCLIVGYQTDARIVEGLAVTPPMIHSFVDSSDKRIQEKLATSPSFVKTLLNSSMVDPDALFIASMRQLANTFEEETYSRLCVIIQGNLTRELSRDSSRLINILRYIGAV